MLVPCQTAAFQVTHPAYHLPCLCVIFPVLQLHCMAHVGAMQMLLPSHMLFLYMDAYIFEALGSFAEIQHTQIVLNACAATVADEEDAQTLCFVLLFRYFSDHWRMQVGMQSSRAVPSDTPVAGLLEYAWCLCMPVAGLNQRT